VIRRVANYEQDLSTLIHESLSTFSLTVKDKTVLLKPNLVGLDPLGVMNTHSAVIAATRECFLRLGAAQVFVGDGPAMDRDTEAIIESVRLREYLGPLGNTFVDLNVDDVERIRLQTHASRLRELYLPKTALGVDLLVSMPKLKTHHWAGVTLSLKNMFGIVPGSCYGWLKNVLHWAGIDRAILDINAAARPDFAIVDGIVGMEGNGPIQGTPKQAGVLVAGSDVAAVDATCCRIMGIDPTKIEYLTLARGRENLGVSACRQTGETIRSVRTPFELVDPWRTTIRGDLAA